MPPARSTALVTELEHALVRCPKDQRASVIQEVIKLFLARQTENVPQLSSFDEVLASLIRQAELADLPNLSSAIANSRLMLPLSLRQLAFHAEASAAVLVLKHSTWLSDQDLNLLAETRDQERLLAISSRSTLSEALTKTLVMRGNESVHLALSRNQGARFSERTFGLFLKTAGRNEQLAQALGKRSDIPPKLVRKLLALVAGKPRLAFLSVAPRGVCARTGQEVAPNTNAPRSYTSTEKEIGALSHKGSLTDSALNRFAITQNYERLTVALALLSPVNVIERLLRGDSVDELVMACKSARLRWTTTASIVRNREGCPQISESLVEERRALFESLSLSEAQYGLRFGDGEAAANPRGIGDASIRRQR